MSTPPPAAALASTPPQPLPPRGDRFLTRLVLIAMATMLLTGAFVLWQVGVAIGHINALLANTTEDLKQITQTTANLAKEVDAITERVDRLRTKSEIALHADDVEELLDAAIAAERPAPAATADREQLESDMQYLLQYIRVSGKTFTGGGKTFSSSTFYWKAYVKYKTWHNSVQTVDEFLDKLEDRMFSKGGYEVEFPANEGGNRKLKDWLLVALKSRTAPAAP